MALRLIVGMGGRAARVLEVGRGSGRNRAALLDAGLAVESVDEDALHLARGPFEGCLSSHALLHGTPATLEADLRRIGALLVPGTRLYATFGSKRDARFGRGLRIAEHVFAPTDGDEAGVAHTFWDDRELHALLAGFELEEFVEVDVDEIAGSWAHATAPLRGAVHWFVIARKI